jgi:hypothetical protein
MEDTLNISKIEPDHTRVTAPVIVADQSLLMTTSIRPPGM